MKLKSMPKVPEKIQANTSSPSELLKLFKTIKWVFALTIRAALLVLIAMFIYTWLGSGDSM
jgi:hypothetical protein